MTACTKAPGLGALLRRVGPECIEIRVPSMDAEEQRCFVEAELLAYADSHSEGTWIVDLSEYVNGVTLALAGGLAWFQEAARQRDCDVRFTGLMPGRGDCRRVPCQLDACTCHSGNSHDADWVVI